MIKKQQYIFFICFTSKEIQQNLQKIQLQHYNELDKIYQLTFINLELKKKLSKYHRPFINCHLYCCKTKTAERDNQINNHLGAEKC